MFERVPGNENGDVIISSTMSEAALVWFRLDLRLADNPALAAATASHKQIVPVFIWAPEEEGKSERSHVVL